MNAVNTIHTPITFDVKAYNAKGVCIDSKTYHTPKLNAFNGHWNVCQRMASTMLKSKKAKTIRYFMDDVEYAFDAEEVDFVKV